MILFLGKPMGKYDGLLGKPWENLGKKPIGKPCYLIGGLEHDFYFFHILGTINHD